MADPKVIIEGEAKYREARKWKNRWCVLTKLSPVADCLHLQLYKDGKERGKHGPTKASLSLEGYIGMESAFTLDRESHTLALICSELEVVIGFDSRENLIQWITHIRCHLPEVQQFLVQVMVVPPKSRLPLGQSRIHLQNGHFSLTTGSPPRLLSTWNMIHLRKYGLIDGKFCFEGGSHSGKGEGLHVLHTNQSEDLAEAFAAAANGKLMSKKKITQRKEYDSCTCWMSGGTCSIHSLMLSTEGTIIPSSASGSTDGSTCELLFSDLSSSFRNPICSNESNETNGSRSTCCTNLRWSSSSGGTSYSLDGDTNQRTSPSSCHQVTSNGQLDMDSSHPYLQNYDVPRSYINSAKSMAESMGSTRTLCHPEMDMISLRSHFSHHSHPISNKHHLHHHQHNKDHHQTDELTFQFNKELDFNVDECNFGPQETTITSRIRSLQGDRTMGSTRSCMCNHQPVITQSPLITSSSTSPSSSSSSTSSSSSSSFSSSSSSHPPTVTSTATGNGHYQVPVNGHHHMFHQECAEVNGKGSPLVHPVPPTCHLKESVQFNSSGQMYDIPRDLKSIQDVTSSSLMSLRRVTPNTTTGCPC